LLPLPNARSRRASRPLSNFQSALYLAQCTQGAPRTPLRRRFLTLRGAAECAFVLWASGGGGARTVRELHVLTYSECACVRFVSELTRSPVLTCEMCCVRTHGVGGAAFASDFCALRLFAASMSPLLSSSSAN
jgi:hypothetical protein